MSKAQSAEPDPFAQTDPKLRPTLVDMWASLKRTTRRAACPRCKTTGLPVRAAKYRRRCYDYVACCGTVILINVR